MRQLRRIGLLFALALSGCASPRTIYFWHPGATNDELHRDMAGCRVQLASVPAAQAPYPDTYNDPGAVGHSMANAGASLQDKADRNALFQDCMTAKGWQMVTDPRGF